MPVPQNPLPATPSPTPETTVNKTEQHPLPIVVRLGIKDAEATALKSNPTISVARLNALASQQVVQEVRSIFWPQTYANLTAVEARNNSRITAGALNNPIIYTRAAVGATVSQLITDF